MPLAQTLSSTVASIPLCREYNDINYGMRLFRAHDPPSLVNGYPCNHPGNATAASVSEMSHWKVLERERKLPSKVRAHPLNFIVVWSLQLHRG